MSEQILPKSKNTYTKSLLLQKTFPKIPNNQPNLTRVLNPLLNTTNKQQAQNSQNASKYSTSSNNPTQNQNHLNPKNCNQPKLKNPQFHFYRADLNDSSDVSFMNNSFQECRDQIEQKICQKFNNSKAQILDLIKQSPSKNKKRPDTKQIKRQKLCFYHCDQIIIRPCLSNKPVKVIDLAIRPTKNMSNLLNLSQSIQPKKIEKCQQRPFAFNGGNGTAKKVYEKKLQDLINESPEENSRNYNRHHFAMESPSFLEQAIEEVNSLKSAKQISLRGFSVENNGKTGPEQLKKEQNFETKSNTSHKSKSSMTVAHILSRGVIKNEENMEENESGFPFKRRNRIFGNDKKSGLKLSRAIRQQAQIKMLEGELGVDFFHIIIEEDQIFKQCCS